MIRQSPQIAFAGDKAIAVKVLTFILGQRVKPLALLITDKQSDSQSKALKKLCPHLSKNLIFTNNQFKSKTAINRMKTLKLDYIISIHFPYVFPQVLLNLPRHGILNLHPAYLPYNRGWHTATWAIISNAPYGATLHFMDKTIDTGDIVMQKKIPILPQDTANSLYRRALKMELKIFQQAWPLLTSFSYQRRPQIRLGSTHLKKDLLKLQRLTNLSLLNRLRALSTSKPEDWAYFISKNKKYRVKIAIVPEK